MSMTRTRQRPAATQVLQHADEKAEIWRPRGSEGGAGCCALNVVSSAKPQQAWRPRLRQRVGKRGEQGSKAGVVSIKDKAAVKIQISGATVLSALREGCIYMTRICRYVV